MSLPTDERSARCRERHGSKWWASGLRPHGVSPRGGVVILALLAAALGLRAAAMAGMALIPEEAYYWMYAQHPSMGYFDHPPMVAWLIRLGTALFGDNEFGVRFGGAVLMLSASGLVYVFGRMWFGRAAALAAAVLLQVLPVYFGTGLIATMDSALVFFWLVGMVGVSVALQRQRAWGWYLAGFGLGGAMLCKYTGVFVGFSALLAVIAHRPWRRQLLSPHPYAGALLAAAMFAPVVIWNAQHDWASFRFQFSNRFEGQSFNLWKPVSYLGIQLLVATPLVLAGTCWFYARTFGKRRRLLTPRWLVATCFSLPLLAVMTYKSMSYGIHLSWTMQAYLCLLPALARLSLAQARLARKRLRGFAWQRAGLATAVGCLGLDILALTYLLAVEPHARQIPALGPWSELAAAVEKVEERVEAETGREPLVIAGGKYRVASVLAFYRKPLEPAVRTSDFTTSQWILSGRGLGYPYWAKQQLWTGSDCVLVDEKDSIREFAPHFKRFDLVEQIRLGRVTYAIAVGRDRRD